MPPNDANAAKTINSDIDKAIDKNLDAALVQHRLNKDVKYSVKNGQRDETGSESLEPDFFSPEANAINVARPELMNMMNAMRGRNRAAAIESGEAALALLSVTNQN